jgi:hypothetical protein
MKAKQCRDTNRFSGKWYVVVGNTGMYYLHKDGIVRNSTNDGTGSYGGYFDTEAEANAAIEAFQQKEQQ